MRSSQKFWGRFWVGLGAVAALASGALAVLSVKDAVLVVSGSSKGDQMGASVGALGDVDGDKVPDFVVGADQAGIALVVSGSSGKTIHTLKGSGGGDYFGFAVASAGDTDGDGVDDIIVGAPYAYSGKSQTGAAYVFSGKSGNLLQSLYGDNYGDFLGASVAGIGDVDGDGNADVIAGAPYAYDPNTGYYPGMAKVFLGNSGKNIFSMYGGTSDYDFGISVCGLGGDVDGDKTPDFAVGCDYGTDGNGRTPGYVNVYSGSSSKGITTVYGSADGDGFGEAVSPAGDVDGDGLADLVVGAEYGQNGKSTPGYAMVLSSKSWKAIHTVYGDEDYTGFGRSVSGGKDLDGDKTPDFVVGGYYMDDGSGVYGGGARAFSGSDGSTLESAYGANSDDYFGYSVAMLDDLTGDGAADVAVGAPFDSTGTSYAGSAFVFGAAAPPVPTGSIVINDDAIGTNSADVKLSLAWEAAGADVKEMRIRDAGDAFGDYVEVADTADWSLPGSDGTKVVEAQFRDADGFESAVVSDSIVLDTAAPSGTVVIAGGAAWVNSTTVGLALTYTDSGSGVQSMQLRNDADAFGTPVAAATSTSWTLGGTGMRQVSVQFIDGAGNVSAVASDTVGVDLEAPTGTFQIAGGAEVVKNPSVDLNFAAIDTGGSGVAEYRVRVTGSPTWGTWTTYTATANFTLPTGDGPKFLDAQFRDKAGNESEVLSDSVALDEGRPFVVSFGLHDPQPFFLPMEAISFDLTAADAAGGSGVDSVKTSWDGGATWTAWTPYAPGVYTPQRPQISGAGTARVIVRDKAGNESNPSQLVALFVLPSDAPDLRSGGLGKGGMADLGDVDVLGVDLVKGDTLNVTITGRASTRKQSFVLAVDLALPDGQRFVQGRYPETSKKPGIKKFVAPETGHYLIVIRHNDTDGDPVGTYAVKVRVKHARSNGVSKGTSESGEFTFDAAAGSKFSASLRGEGLDPESVTLEGPNGPVAANVTLKRGKVNIAPVVLESGTGTYTVKFAATGPVSFN